MRRLLALVPAVLLICSVAATASIATVASASAATCLVTNLSTAKTYHGFGPDLQKAIDRANAGTTLQITGTCYGNFTVSKALTLLGEPSTQFPVPTLDGNDAGTVLMIPLASAAVSLTDLRVSDGSGTRCGLLAHLGADCPGGLGKAGGGIVNIGSLYLKGSTSVVGNHAFFGGGVYGVGPLALGGSSSVSNNRATWGGGIFETSSITLRRSSSVSSNRSNGIAGGIYDTYGEVTMFDSSSLSNNTAGNCGGIDADLTMYGSSSIVGNTAEESGGGVCGGAIMNDRSAIKANEAVNGVGGGISAGGVVTMNGASTVSANSSGQGGGGVFVFSTQAMTMNDNSTVTGNTVNWPQSASSGLCYGQGGGICNLGSSLKLDGSAAVIGNTVDAVGGGQGGGIFNGDYGTLSGTVKLYASSSVIGNTAGGGSAAQGGGIYNDTGDTVKVCAGTVKLSPNNPDDYPAGPGTYTTGC